jgi:hypothetical protein
MAKSSKPAPPPEKPAQIMSYSDYARHRGVTYQTVKQWATQGLIKRVSLGRVDVAASDAMRQERGATGPGSKSLAPAATGSQPERPTDETSPWTHAEAQRVAANYAAMQRKLEFEEQAGHLIPVSDVAGVVTAEYASVRTKMLAMGAELGPKLLNHRDADVPAALIVAEVTRILQDLSYDGGASGQTGPV